MVSTATLLRARGLAPCRLFHHLDFATASDSAARSEAPGTPARPCRRPQPRSHPQHRARQAHPPPTPAGGRWASSRAVAAGSGASSPPDAVARRAPGPVESGHQGAATRPAPPASPSPPQAQARMRLWSPGGSSRPAKIGVRLGSSPREAGNIPAGLTTTAGMHHYPAAAPPPPSGSTPGSGDEVPRSNKARSRRTSQRATRERADFRAAMDELLPVDPSKSTDHALWQRASPQLRSKFASPIPASMCSALAGIPTRSTPEGNWWGDAGLSTPSPRRKVVGP